MTHQKLCNSCGRDYIYNDGHLCESCIEKTKNIFSGITDLDILEKYACTQMTSKCRKCGKFAELPTGQPYCHECWVIMGEPEPEGLFS